MKISKEEFDSVLKEDQQLILEVLAESPDVPVAKFYKVAGFLEYLNLFSGVIYSVLDTGSNNQDKNE